MNSVLQAIYPLFVGIWVAAHFATNKRASSIGSGCYSTKIAIDDAVPFMPGMTLLYLSGFVLGNMAYFLLGSADYFWRIAIGYGIQFVASLSLYLLFPCRIERCEDFKPNSISSQLLAFFQRVSKPFNAFPSMHVSYSLFSALWILGSGSLYGGIAMIGWALLVALSALLTKQHYVADVLLGAALGAEAYMLIV